MYLQAGIDLLTNPYSTIVPCVGRVAWAGGRSTIPYCDGVFVSSKHTETLQGSSSSSSKQL